MESTSTGPSAPRSQDDLAVLAVGALTGHERARLLAHLEECPQCSAKLEELSVAADALTSLVPDAMPIRGFRRPHRGPLPRRAAGAETPR